MTPRTGKPSYNTTPSCKHKYKLDSTANCTVVLLEKQLAASLLDQMLFQTIFLISFTYLFHKVECLPNIVILFADNLGYNDVGTFNSDSDTSTTRTPNIDKLGRDGLKFNNWNSAAALCSASRSALLTGRYPVRSGIFPSVFKPDAQYGLGSEEVTIAEYLKEQNYSTSIVGKWHLGQREEYLPTNHGFDEWYGIPYHMSGGSLDNHLCGFDPNATIWLPLFDGTEIVQQPVDLTNLAQRYASKAKQFIERNVARQQPFFLYVPFSHVHQLCAPQQNSCQWASKQFSKDSPKASFGDSVEEMDWIAGEIIDQLDKSNVANETVVFFTSDNGPWVAEKSCSGSKGPFEGRWLRDNVPGDCTACPLDYSPSPTTERPRRCVLTTKEQLYEIDGVHCGEDVGLGSYWEANVRMPAIVRWPGEIKEGRETMDMVSTLDIFPTILNLVGKSPRDQLKLDGMDITPIMFDNTTSYVDDFHDRVLYFWRDGFRDGPLPPPYGRFDVVAAKVGSIKAWFYTKSAHYNEDEEVYHDPPLIFDIISDPAEAYPLNPEDYKDEIERILAFVKGHKASVDWREALTIARDPKFYPCSDRNANCRSSFEVLDGTDVKE